MLTFGEECRAASMRWFPHPHHFRLLQPSWGCSCWDERRSLGFVAGHISPVAGTGTRWKYLLVSVSCQHRFFGRFDGKPASYLFLERAFLNFSRRKPESIELLNSYQFANTARCKCLSEGGELFSTADNLPYCCRCLRCAVRAFLPNWMPSALVFIPRKGCNINLN